jgi:hypothetical protein
MSSDVVFYVGAFIKFNEPVEVVKVTERRICPVCNTERFGGKYCITCGTAIIRKVEEKKSRVTNPDAIMAHVGYKIFEDGEKFMTFPYGDEVIVPNYRSSYNTHISGEDVGKTLLFVEVDRVKENAITELRANAWELIRLLDNHGVDYSIVFGITVGQY